MSSIAQWSFAPIVPAFPPTVFPNVALWNISNGVDLEYQVEVSWPFEWESRHVDKPALAMYVLDGNALGMTATEGFKRRKPVDGAQPDSVVVSIGYPLTDSVYSPQRLIDFRPPLPEPQDPPSGADPFIAFIDKVLRPFIHSTVFPNIDFTREALYGHSGGGLFVIYALITRPDLFDTFLSASPAIFLNNGSILDEVRRLESANSTNRPAFAISYGSLEQFPVRRRTETEEVFRRRKAFIEAFRMTDNCNELHRRIKNSSKLRDVVLKEYIGQDHAGVGGSALTDGIDYFVDW